MKQALVLDPVRVYMVPNRISLQVWESHTCDGGILFDRCRILQYAYPVDSRVLQLLQTWMGAAVTQQQRIMKKGRKKAK